MEKVPTTHMNIVLTSVCNRDCPGCIFKVKTKGIKYNKYLTMVNAKKALEFAKKNGVKTVAFTGGEPTLHPHLLEIVKMFSNSNIETSIYTNYDFPNIVKSLDGIINKITASYYGQDMPHQKDFLNSEVEINTLLYKDYFKNLEDLNKFIDKYKEQAGLYFTAPTQVNDYVENNIVDFLDQIESEMIIWPDGFKSQMYRGYEIRRSDLKNEFFIEENIPWKVRVDGIISHYYNESTAKLAEEITEPKFRAEVLSTHNVNKRKILLQKKS